MGYLKTYRWFMNYDTEKDGSLPNGGIILRHVRHDNYNLAKEIRVVGFWIEFETFTNEKSTKKESRFYPLDKVTFNYNNSGKPLLLDERSDVLKKKVQDLKDKKLYDQQPKQDKEKYARYLGILDDLQDFSKYNFIKGIQASYSLKNDFNFTNCEFGGLMITQTYLFSDYQKSPAHEPSGGLMATRLFPLIKTQFIAPKNPPFDKEAKIQTKINSIRIDYKFHPCLDTYLYSSDVQKQVNATTNAQWDEKQKQNPASYTNDKIHILKNKPQQAGVFIDRESVSYIKGGFGGAEDAIFEAAEKPLIYEMAGIGLAKGTPFYMNEDGDFKTWDNIHWWGGYKNIHIPSAPGAFHALHLHWRWGGAAQGGILPPYPKSGKESQFIKSGVPSKVLNDKRYLKFLGPLVDPKIWIQSIRFAIVKYNKIEDESTTTKDFGEKFKNKIEQPTTNLKRIDNGEDLLLWYSIELHREVILPEYYDEDIALAPGNMRVKIQEETFITSLTGTVFIHGLFFAHEQEPKDPPITVGSTDEEYFPKKKTKIIKEMKFNRDAKF
jgi:hypothetical protein